MVIHQMKIENGVNGMLTKAEVFFESIQDKKVTFIGMGVSHFDCIKLFMQKNIRVTVADKRTAEQLGERYQELLKLGVRFELGEHYLDNLCDADIIFRTPGMNFFSPVLSKARELGKVVTSEMEVFFDLCPCKLYAVTGSDGKTTTTTLISEFLKAQGKTVHLGGNIGRALLPIIESIDEHDAAVVELSSFQLISMRKSPDVAVVTNVAPNHLDVHKDMDEYIAAKKNILLHQNAFSKTVLNMDNDITNQMSELVRGKLYQFSRRSIPNNGAYLSENGSIIMVNNGEQTEIMKASDIRLPGIHNVENYLTAISAVYDDVDRNNIVKVAREFGGVEHRIEFVREVGGVKYYNDSIATSPTRTIAGLNSFGQKLVVIAGGYDKKIPFEPLAPKLIEKCKLLILMGLTADKIEKAVTECDGYNPEELKILHVSTMEEVVQVAKDNTTQGDIVTLSPACASFDKYPNFEARGNHYKGLVNAL